MFEGSIPNADRGRSAFAFWDPVCLVCESVCLSSFGGLYKCSHIVTRAHGETFDFLLENQAVLVAFGVYFFQKVHFPINKYLHRLMIHEHDYISSRLEHCDSIQVVFKDSKDTDFLQLLIKQTESLNS